MKPNGEVIATNAASEPLNWMLLQESLEQVAKWLGPIHHARVLVNVLQSIIRCLTHWRNNGLSDAKCLGLGLGLSLGLSLSLGPGMRLGLRLGLLGLSLLGLCLRLSEQRLHLNHLLGLQGLELIWRLHG